MSSAADKKRWAILPPPSAASSQISGEFPLSEEIERKTPARRTVSGAVLRSDLQESRDEVGNESAVQELEPSDSERVTEVPPTANSREEVPAFGQAGLETIPAPPWMGEED